MGNPWVQHFIEQYPIFREEDCQQFLENAPEGSAQWAAPRPTTKELWKQASGLSSDIRKSIQVDPGRIDPLRPDPYLLASKAFPHASLAYDTALRFWLRQEAPKLVPVLTLVGQEAWTFPTDQDTWRFRPVKNKACLAGTLTDRGTRINAPYLGTTVSITSRERTLVDAFDYPNLLECETPSEQLKAYQRLWIDLQALFPPEEKPLDQDSLLAYARLIGNDTAIAKLGVFLDYHREHFGIEAQLLRELQSIRPKGLTAWLPKGPPGVPPMKPNWDWSIKVPIDLVGWTYLNPFDAKQVSDDSEESREGWNSEKDTGKFKQLEDQFDQGKHNGLSAATVEGLTEEEYKALLDAGGHPIRQQIDPDHLPSFTTQPFGTDLDSDLLGDLWTWFEFEAFKPGQEHIIRAVLSGKDTLGILPTGGGKSLIYQFLTKKLQRTTLVISPLVALMDDQIQEARDLRLKAASINGSMDQEARDHVKILLETGALDLLFLSPESLFTLYPLLLRSREKIGLIVVDEAHCISAWGFSFRTSFHELHNLRAVFGEKLPVLALTATARETTRDDIIYYLQLQNPYLHLESISRKNLRLESRTVPWPLASKLKPLRAFLAKRNDQQGIVYCLTRSATEEVAKYLRTELHLPAEPYHAGMDAIRRRETALAFKQGQLQIVVATIAFGMGINKDNIRFVAHMNLPASLEGYVQEIGRAGRDQAPSDCILFHHPGDAGFHRGMARKLHPNHLARREGEIDVMQQFAKRRGQCRHQAIAHYFSELETPRCESQCDSCQNNGSDNDAFSPMS